MKKVVVNQLTHEKIELSPIVDEEVLFDGGVMITETDTAGIITYANRKFREMTGFSKQELIGAPHSINRHPDMPRGSFKGMLKTIKEGKVWQGYVKNRRKDGRFYWVLVYIKPRYDEQNKFMGYIAGRKVASRDAIEEIEKYYDFLFEDVYMDHKFFMSHELVLPDDGYRMSDNSIPLAAKMAAPNIGVATAK